MPEIPKSVGISESEALAAIITDFSSVTEIVKTRVQQLDEKVQSNIFSTSKGISLLETKFHTLLSYSTHLAFSALLKLQQKSIINHPTIDALLENRTVLEKIKPLEQKLKYQIDKLVKTAVLHQDSNLVTSDPLLYKPNPQHLIQDSALDSVDKNEDEKTSIYKPPKLAPVPYTDRINTGKLSEKNRDKASKSRLLNDLKAQYDDRPEEFSVEGTGYGARDVTASKEDKQWNEREAFEEENFMRLNMTKQDKKLERKLSKKGAMLRFNNEFQDLEQDFKDLSGVNRAVEDEDKFKYGQEGIIRKRNQQRAELDENPRGSRNAGEMISGYARARKSGQRNSFKKDVKKNFKKSKKA